MTHTSFCPTLFVCMIFSSPLWGVEPHERPAGVHPPDHALRRALTNPGDSRTKRLRQAIEQDPDNQLARGHLGYVRVDNRWLTERQAVCLAAKDERLKRYAALRNDSDSLRGQLQLARYCQRNQLPERAEMHWSNVLILQPHNSAAIRMLGLKRYKSGLYTAEQIAAIQQQEKVEKEWRPKFKQWVRSIREDDINTAVSLAKLRAIRNSALVPLLHSDVSPASEALSLEVVEILAEIADRISIESLVLHAIDSPHESVRTAAIKHFKRQPLLTVAPLLLVSLETPIEMAVQRVQVDERLSFVHTDYSIERPLATSDLAQRFSRSKLSPAAVARLNKQIAQRNLRILIALRDTTGEDHGENPRAWWDWWLEYNDYAYQGGETPVLSSSFTRSFFNPGCFRLASSRPSPHSPRSENDKNYTTRPAQPRVRIWTVRQMSGSRLQHYVLRTSSCFAADTSISTETGPLPIQHIRAGDRVLSQNIKSGSLSYSLVLQTTRRIAETVRLRLEDEEIVLTGGHPLWVEGAGWRMAREIKAGDRLHGIEGPRSVTTRQEGPKLPVYNLIVAGENNNYFVGQHQLLAHDATLRRPTEHLLPGLRKEK